jgi:DNA-binding NarL/FixJ family response regulator
MSIQLFIVEDSELIRNYFAKLCSMNSKFEIVGQASTGVEAVSSPLIGKADLIVMDIMMPEMDGITAVQTLRRQGCEVPILMFSALDDREKAGAALAAGAQGFLVKTATMTVLLQTMEDLASGESVIMERELSDKLIAMCQSAITQDD